jgi:magnesium transporter
MLSVKLYRNGALQTEEVDAARAAALLKEQDVGLWLDVRDPDEAELEILRREFSIHPLSLEDVQHWHQRSKVEVFPDYFGVVVHGLHLNADDRLEDREIHLFVGHRFVITVRDEPLLDLEPIHERVRRQPELAAVGGGFLLYTLLDEVVDGYLEIVDRYEDLSDEVEDRVFQADGQTDVQQAIFHLKRQVVRFRRIVTPLREVVDLIQEQPGFVSSELVPYYRDVLDHVIRTIEFIDNIRDLLTTALEAQLSQVSNRLNVVMKKLSSWAGIVLVPTLIAGIYGMNFRHMPELKWEFGYPLALGSMVLVMGVLYWVFKRKDWL